jgi:hypothetical protein
MTRIVEQLRAPRAVTPPASAPGPWGLDGLSVVCGGFRSHPTRKIVCTVRSHPNTPAAQAEAAATARLIAAAPELLAALENIASYPKHGEPEEPGSTHKQDWQRSGDPLAVMDALHSVIDAARAAISAAKGGV